MHFYKRTIYIYIYIKRTLLQKRTIKVTKQLYLTTTPININTIKNLSTMTFSNKTTNNTSTNNKGNITTPHQDKYNKKRKYYYILNKSC